MGAAPPPFPPFPPFPPLPPLPSCLPSNPDQNTTLSLGVPGFKGVTCGRWGQTEQQLLGLKHVPMGKGSTPHLKIMF